MFGRSWNAGTAKIIEVHARKTSGDGMVTIHEYAADVQVPGSELVRVVIQEPSIATNFWSPSRGDVVKVLVHSRSGKVKFDKSDPQLDARKRMKDDDSSFAATAAARPGTPGS